MQNSMLIHNALCRLKNLLLERNTQKDYDEYCFKFKKIMELLDGNNLSIPRRLEDFFFDAGLPDGTNPAFFRNRATIRPVERPVKRKWDECKRKIDFLNYHKGNGHPTIEQLEAKAKTDNYVIENIRECKNCTKHKLIIDFLSKIPTPKTTVTRKMEQFHCFLSPQFPRPGFNGDKFYLLIVDNFSKMMFTYTIKEQNEIPKILVKFMVHCTSRFSGRLRRLITQNLPKLNDHEFENFLFNRKVNHKIVERDEFMEYYNKKIQVMLKLMISDAKSIDDSIWSEGIKAAVYVYNNLPNESLNLISPGEIWQDNSLVLADHFYPFGKWFMASYADRTIKQVYRCRFVGFHPHDRSFLRMYDPKNETIGFGRIVDEVAEQETD